MEDFRIICLGAAVVATAIVLGGMIVFTGFLAPLVFRKIEKRTADAFMRDAFGPYYGFMAVLCGIAAAGALVAQPPEALIMGLVGVTFLLARYVMMPQAQRLHDARERGEYGAADEFARVHKRGAFLNMIQMVAVLIALLRLAI